MNTELQGAEARPPNVRPAYFALAVLAILVLTRLPIAPKYLYFFDSVNFALSLDDFNPALHQPQPPGYPLFVGLIRLLHLLIPKPEHVLLAAGIVAAFGAALLIRQIAAEMFAGSAGYLAATLLIFHPAFWFGGVTNQVRLCLALGSCAVALMAWRAVRRPQNAGWLYAAFFALGITAGFRPALGVLLMPLLLWSWWKNGGSPRRLTLGAALLIAAAIPWMAATVVAVGGPQAWLELMRNYSNEQFSGTSAFFGAQAPSALKMAGKAAIWNGLGALAWIWAIPFVYLLWRAPRWREEQWQQRAAFLAVWGLPIFLFSAFVHIGDPDQALGSIPVLCVIGDGVLTAFLRKKGNRRMFAAAAGVAAVNTFLFFYPPPGPAVASGYRAVRYMDDLTQSAIRSIEELRTGVPVTILHYRSLVSWRQLSYYFPDDYVMYLPASSQASPWTLRKRKRLETQGLPETQRFILVDPLANPAALAEDGWISHGSVYYRDLRAGPALTVGPHRLIRGAFSQ